MHTGETWRLGRRPGLDGLRGIAILLVMVSHALPDPLGPAGPVGVTVFFVLSGFLITSLLLEERERRGAVSFGGFYARRARRLLPALVVMVATVAALGTVVGGLTTPGGVIAALFYFANFVKAHGSDALGGLGHTWSLSVEEQFYALWPVVVVATVRWGRRAVGVAAGVGIVGSVLFRLLSWHGAGSYYAVNYSSLSHADGLLLGCLLAVGMPMLWRRRTWPSGSWPSAVLLAGVLGWCATSALWWRVVVQPSGVAVLAAALILVVLERPGFLGARWLQWVGRRSYAMYLWHYPLIFLAGLLGGGQAAVIAAAVVSMGVAEVSWRLVERPFLQRQVMRKKSNSASVTTPLPALSADAMKPM